MKDRVSNKIAGSTLRFIRGLATVMVAFALFLVFLGIITIAIKLV